MKSKVAGILALAPMPFLCAYNLAYYDYVRVWCSRDLVLPFPSSVFLAVASFANKGWISKKKKKEEKPAAKMHGFFCFAKGF